MNLSAKATSLALLAFAAVPACAEDAALSEAEDLILSRLIDSACIDVHPHPGCETFTLLQNTTDPSLTDLFIFADRRSGEDQRTLLVARNATFLGSIFGGEPSIALNDAGSVVLNSQQDGIGRHPWYQTITIAWRDGAFVVDGYSFSSYDRGTGDTFSCDVNYLTGGYHAATVIVGAAEDGSLNQETVDHGQASIAAIPMADGLGHAGMPSVCHAISDVFYQ